MLNPEYVDRIKGDLVEIGFTDGIDNDAFIMKLTEKDAWSLAKMIINKLNMNAKTKYSNRPL